jgi:hypothetical protein
MKLAGSMIDKPDNSRDQQGELSLVLTTKSQIYLEMVMAALDGEGIPALVKSVAGYHSRGMLPFNQGFFDYNLFVSKENEVKAREIVETIVPPEELG